MFSLFRKEITQFFGSITGTMVSVVFLIFTGLLLWVFPGNYNIPEGGYATLDGLFAIAPWIYLFLIPAVTCACLPTKSGVVRWSFFSHVRLQNWNLLFPSFWPPSQLFCLLYFLHCSIFSQYTSWVIRSGVSIRGQPGAATSDYYFLP